MIFRFGENAFEKSFEKYFWGRSLWGCIALSGERVTFKLYFASLQIV